MATIHKFHSDYEIEQEVARNKKVTSEDVCKTFGRPVFVYGTLLRGFGNYKRLLEGYTSKTLDAKLYGYSISSGGAFPYMAKIKSGTPVSGELVYIPEEKYLEVLRRLDWLEGVESGFYQRVKVRVITPEGSKIAWAYTGERYYSPHKHIKSGSWRQHVMEVQKSGRKI